MNTYHLLKKTGPLLLIIPFGMYYHASFLRSALAGIMFLGFYELSVWVLKQEIRYEKLLSCLFSIMCGLAMLAIIFNRIDERILTFSVINGCVIYFNNGRKKVSKIN